MKVAGLSLFKKCCSNILATFIVGLCHFASRQVSTLFMRLTWWGAFFVARNFISERGSDIAFRSHF